MVGLYYNMIIAWILLYFVRSFQRNLPVDGEGFDTSSAYFTNVILQAVNPWECKHIIGYGVYGPST